MSEGTVTLLVLVGRSFLAKLETRNFLIETCEK